MSQALTTDLYQLTMMQAYFTHGHNPYSTFDYFIRKIPFGSYLLVAGLQYVLSYINGLRFDSDDIEYLKTQNLFTKDFLEYLENFRFTGEIIGMPEGELAFQREPILRVRAPIIEAQLIETLILNRMNFSSLIATKASRVVYAAEGRHIAEFGLRRAQGEAQLEATRACFIGGCASTSNVFAGKELTIPITGTMAHSFVTSFEKEIDAFRAYSEVFPDNTTLLIDTYDSFEGARNTVIIAKELKSKGHRLKAVRLDSGDIATLSRGVRKILDENECSYVKIFASSDLNEWKIEKLLRNGAPIDAFGVGTEMITARPNPALGGVYKLVEIEDKKGNSVPKMKLSDEPAKATLPGKKMVWRFFNQYGLIEKDVIALEGENIDTKNAKEVLVPLVQTGKVIYRNPELNEIQDQARENLSRLPEEYLAFDNEPGYPVELSAGLDKLTCSLANSLRVIRDERCL